MKPLLAGELTDPTKLRFPVYVSPKYDGIRCLIVDGQAVSRTLKPIPNHHIRKTLSRPELSGLDGEIIAGSTFQETTGNVMRHEGEPDFTFHVFDDFTFPAHPFLARFNDAVRRLVDSRLTSVAYAPQTLCEDWGEVQATHAGNSVKFEGSMIRSPTGPYKFGRSSEIEGTLLKLKNFKTLEAKITGFKELLRNENEATTDALGRTKRSSHKANKIPAGTLGAFELWCPEFGDFECGTGEGLTKNFRKEVWLNKALYLGKLVSFQYQPDGTKDKPRIPSFRGIRDPIDIS